MRQTDASALFSLASRPPVATGQRAAARAKAPTEDVQPFEPTLRDNDRPVAPHDNGREVGRRDGDRREATSTREARSSETRGHDAPKNDRKLKDAKPGPKPHNDGGDDGPEVEPTDDQQVDATAETTTATDDSAEACDPATASADAGDAPADDVALPLVLASLLGDADATAGPPQDVAAPPQLPDDGAQQDESEESPPPVEATGEGSRSRGVGRAVSSAVHAVIAAAGKGAGADAHKEVQEAPTAPVEGEQAPPADQHLGPQVSAAAKAAIEAAGKGQAPNAVAKLAHEAPASDSKPDVQTVDLKPADVDAPQNQPGTANAAPSVQAMRASDATSESRARLPVVRDVPLGAVPIEIGMRAMAGVRRFDIRLDPPDLGRVDVRLDMGDDGTVKAHLTVDKVETLALLQRDARTLERAFEQAGLKPSDSGVDLTLRDQGFTGHRQGAGGEQQRFTPPTPAFNSADMADGEPARLLWRGTTGLDLRV